MNTHPANRLIHEKSPYLLQHAHNPVDWYPWGEEAFAKAHAENKPVFLSIGYSTCHWCHVMERESFESQAIAKLLNDHFVAIKVDREERPDLDSVYMSVVQALTGHGGWPMSVFLTPDKKPFFGGTYFPPQPKWGAPGFADLLYSIQQNWKSQEDKIRESGNSIIAALQERAQHAIESSQMPTLKFLDEAYLELKDNFDPQYGGFGHAPKFPMGHTLGFLLRYGTILKQPQAQTMVEQTLNAMALGGIFDQLGGGFHRYSTDAKWQVPHFEKMLYDQALLSKIYLEAFHATGHSFFSDVTRLTLEYVLRDLTHPQGGFYSAEDADSFPAGGPPEIQEKKEGAFYIWSEAQLQAVLSSEEWTFVKTWFSIHPSGNAEFDPHGEFIGFNILHAEPSLTQVAEKLTWPVEKATEVWLKAKEKLFTHRALRPRPHRDEKVLVDWNSLMISSFVLAGQGLQDPRYLAAGVQAADFILRKLVRSDGRLLHRYALDEAGILGGLEDYAFFIQALLDCYECTFEEKYLKEAIRLTAEMQRLFYDAKTGTYFLTAQDGEQLFLRPREVYDGAVPSGNSVTALNLIRLFHLTHDEQYHQTSETLLAAFGNEISRRPSAYCQFLMAVQFFMGPVKDLSFSGDSQKGDGAEMLKHVYQSWIPQRTLKKIPASDRSQVQIIICENQTCQKPISILEELKNFI